MAAPRCRGIVTRSLTQTRLPPNRKPQRRGSTAPALGSLPNERRGRAFVQIQYRSKVIGCQQGAPRSDYVIGFSGASGCRVSCSGRAGEPCLAIAELGSHAAPGSTSTWSELT